MYIQGLGFYLSPYKLERDYYRKCSNEEWQNFVKYSRSM